MRFMKPLMPYTYAALRIVAGWMFMLHGTAKMFAWPAGKTVILMSQSGVAGVLELVCGALITVGLFTSYAAFLASGLMAFAYFIAHASGGFYPTVNKGELAVLYCFLWLFVSAYGSGPFALDNLRRGGKR